MKRPRRLFTVRDGRAVMFTTGDYNRATRLARDLAAEAKIVVIVNDERGPVYTVDGHGNTTTLRDVRD